jgi:hypothetical protein
MRNPPIWKADCKWKPDTMAMIHLGMGGGWADKERNYRPMFQSGAAETHQPGEELMAFRWPGGIEKYT